MALGNLINDDRFDEDEAGATHSDDTCGSIIAGIRL